VCLEPERNEPSGPARVLSHIKGAILWLEDAVNDRLLERDQPWELPDFRMESDAPAMFFIESEASFSSRSERIGQSGKLDLAEHSQARAVVPVRFYRGADVVHTSTTSPSFSPPTRTSPADWMLLDSFIVERHTRPKTFEELERVAVRSNLDIWPLINRAMKRPAIGGYHYLLVGAPIPKIVGQAPVEVHWQAIAVPAALVRSLVKEDKTRTIFRRDRLRIALRGREIPWARSTNVSSERLLQRGALNEVVRKKRVCILGCGALGSHIASLLARGGAHDLALFDQEKLELENLGRHILTATDVGMNKAVALARHLKGCYPQASIVGFSWPLPLAPVEATTRAREAIENADVIIDCTADDSVFRWASESGLRQRILALHMYVNAGASMLTMIASGKHVSCAKVDRALHGDIESGAAPFTQDEYDPPLAIEPGTGCWSATWPGRGSDIACLSAAAAPILEQLIGRARQSRGVAVVVRRLKMDAQLRTQALVEVAFTCEYR
jgi:hypothetical protein